MYLLLRALDRHIGENDWISMLGCISLAVGRKRNWLKLSILFMLIKQDVVNIVVSTQVLVIKHQIWNLVLALTVMWANYLTSLCLCLLNCKIEKTTVFTLKKKNIVKMKCQKSGVVPGTHYMLCNIVVYHRIRNIYSLNEKCKHVCICGYNSLYSEHA